MFTTCSTARRAAVGAAALSALAVAVGVPASASAARSRGHHHPLRHHRVHHSASRAFALATGGAAAVTAPGGQSAIADVLPQSARSFDGSPAGWSALTAPLAWLPTVGHSGPGALALTSTGLFSAAGSPAFPVTPGARYSANAWTRAGLVGHAVGLGLRFYDASGTLITGGSVLGQSVADTPAGWSQTPTVVGFAPGNAVTAQVTVNSMDNLLSLVDYVDDVNLTQTTGIAAPLVGPLTTSGSHVLDAQGRIVHLHGIQLGGLKNRGYTANTVTTSEVAAAQAWGANFARLPLAENPAVPGDCSYDPSYLSIVDRIVNDVTSRGMMILLDLHSNAVTPCGDYGQQQKLPDANAVTFWQLVANRYKDNPLVAFDLYNEPEGITDAVWHNGGSVTSGGVTYTAPGMQKLYDTVRSTGADNLVFLSGDGWATNYPAKAPLTGTANTVWAVHAYTCPHQTPANGGDCTPGPNGLMDPTGILDDFATAGTTAPVMITEFGYPDRNIGGTYIANAQSYAASHDWVGWNVFVFDNGTASPFDLVKDTGPLWDPAASGMAVISGMLGD